jgi:hypothetical protein
MVVNAHETATANLCTTEKVSTAEVQLPLCIDDHDVVSVIRGAASLRADKHQRWLQRIGELRNELLHGFRWSAVTYFRLSEAA